MRFAGKHKVLFDATVSFEGDIVYEETAEECQPFSSRTSLRPSSRHAVLAANEDKESTVKTRI